jgi:hypothetical protein
VPPEGRIVPASLNMSLTGPGCSPWSTCSRSTALFDCSQRLPRCPNLAGEVDASDKLERRTTMSGIAVKAASGILRRLRDGISHFADRFTRRGPGALLGNVKRQSLRQSMAGKSTAALSVSSRRAMQAPNRRVNEGGRRPRRGVDGPRDRSGSRALRAPSPGWVGRGLESTGQHREGRAPARGGTRRLPTPYPLAATEAALRHTPRRSQPTARATRMLLS